MPSTKNYLNFILEQLPKTGDISYHAMMGEYVIYYRGKVIGGVYDDRFLVKPTKTAVSITENATYAIPYDGAKPMLTVEDLENTEYLSALVNAVYADLK